MSYLLLFSLSSISLTGFIFIRFCIYVSGLWKCIRKIKLSSVYDSHSSLICRADHAGVGSKTLAYHSVSGHGSHGSSSQFLIAQPNVDASVRNVNLDDVAILYLSDVTTCSSFWTDVSDA